MTPPGDVPGEVHGEAPGEVPGDAPEILRETARDWRPEATTVRGRIDPWPARALAALLGGEAPAEGEGLPPLWHEVYLRDARSLGELAEDGHPVSDALLPPLPARRRMFGGGRVETAAPLRVGDEAARTSRVVDRRVRRGRSGWLLLVTEEHVLRVGGDVRVTDRRDIVYRQAADVRHAHSARKPGSEQEVSEWLWRLDVPTDERMLFMLSALTYNAHRIHYDAPYTREVEGHPGLLVHGPLLALGCVEVVRRHAGAVRTMEYRLTAPAYAGEPLTFRARPDGAGSVRVSGTQRGRECVRATVAR